MDNIDNTPPSYAALHFLVRRGNLLAILFGLAPLVGAIIAVAFGYTALLLVAGVIAAAFAYLIMRSYVEMVRLIVDMLLPK